MLYGIYLTPGLKLNLVNFTFRRDKLYLVSVATESEGAW